jgi:hypothetical protein
MYRDPDLMDLNIGSEMLPRSLRNVSAMQSASFSSLAAEACAIFQSQYAQLAANAKLRIVWPWWPSF